MNTNLLRKIQKQILKEPRQFDMSLWFQASSEAPNCGTTACIAGWAVAIAANKNPLQAARLFDKRFLKSKYRDRIDGDYWIEVTAKARETLAIAEGEAQRLFQVSYWPEKYRHAYYSARLPKRCARIASNRISHFIKTKGEE